jgi:hypothetical protein
MIYRRTLLKSLGVCIALPMVESILPTKVARAQASVTKKRFIGCFFPSGAPMPGAVNGDWGYTGNLGGALKPLSALGVASNVSVMRGFRAVDNFDVHWSGTAAFLSSQVVGTTTAASPTSDPAYKRCAKTFDQFIADLKPDARIRSLQAGYSQLPGWDDGHDRHGSIAYVNSISWRDAVNPLSNISDPLQMFTRVFGAGGSVDNLQVQYALKRRKSILDGVLEQYKHHRATLSSEDQGKLDAYAQGIREVEGDLTNSLRGTTCSRPAGDTSTDGYLQRFRTMQKIIIAAMQCDLTRSATIMYNDGIGPNNPIAAIAAQQHDSAHNDWAKLLPIVQAQVGLWGELIAGLKAANLLGETVTVLGSNMSDGRTHNPANIPLLVASQNVASEMKLGVEIQATPAVTDVTQNRNLADLYVDLFKLYGVNQAFGAGGYASTGRASGILR